MAKPPQPNRRTGIKRPLSVQRLEDRRLLAATPMGATVFDTGEFLLGTVGVVPIFFESDGTIDPQTQNWDPGEIDEMLAKITEGVNWWSRMLDTLDTVHTLEFVVDDTFARDPVLTPYEPIDRISNDFTLYAGGFLEDQGYGDAGSFENAVHRFNHDQRLRLGTDWAFSIFVVDASADPDGQFAAGGSFSNAFAYPGGLFFVLPSSRPTSTVAHEMGHIFWARDEYPGGGSWTDQRGYYDAQNFNAADNPSPGFVQQVSIMRAGEGLRQAYAAEPWETPFSPESTLAMVGWRDSDGNGIFDVADVPLDLDAVGYFDVSTGRYHIRGEASAVPLRNQNSSGPQSDITLNRVSRLEYALDDGPWRTAASPDAQRVELDVSIEIEEPFDTIRWRVIDGTVGVTSPVVEGSRNGVAFSRDAARGFAFLDLDGDGERGETEPLLAGATVAIRREDGSPLQSGEIEAGTLGEGPVSGSVEGVTLEPDGIVLENGISVLPASDAGDRLVFQAFDRQRLSWSPAWSFRAALVGRFDSPTGSVSVDFASLGRTGYGRVEAFDAEGVLLTRVTSEAIEAGETASVTLHDPLGRIASIRGFGHAGTSVAIEAIRHGIPDEITTDASGGWAFPNLGDGRYQVDVTPQWADQAFTQSSFVVDVAGGEADSFVAVAQRVTSPRHNVANPYDVNEDSDVTALDALLIINDLSRNGPRRLSFEERFGNLIDVNDDGHVSALDALLVINRISRGAGGGSGEGEMPEAAEPTGAAAAAGVGTAAGATVDVVMADWPKATGSEPIPGAVSDPDPSEWPESRPKSNGIATGESDVTGTLGGSATAEPETETADLPGTLSHPLSSEYWEPFLSSEL